MIKLFSASVAQNVVQMITEKSFVKERFYATEVSYIFRKLLVARSLVDHDEDPTKRKFSDLIEDILKPGESREESMGLSLRGSNSAGTVSSTGPRAAAKGLLEIGFAALTQDKDKGFVAQALARLLITQFQEAERWAQVAVRILPNNFTMQDTLGQVYKKRLKLVFPFSFLLPMLRLILGSERARL